MIGVLDVDDFVEIMFEFVQVIGDVGGEIGIQVVFVLDDVVFFVVEGSGFELVGVVLYVQMVVFFEQIDVVGDEVGVEQGLF